MSAEAENGRNSCISLFNYYCLYNLAFWLQYVNKLVYFFVSETVRDGIEIPTENLVYLRPQTARRNCRQVIATAANNRKQ